MPSAQLIFPHQLFVEHLDADLDTVMVLVEPDLFFRQLPFHKHKLVLHRASMKAFERRLQEAGFATVFVRTMAEISSDEQLAEVLRANHVDEVSVYELVDDWLERDVARVTRSVGCPLVTAPTPGFLTTTDQLEGQFAGKRPRMHSFYQSQRRRLGILMDGDAPVGGRWSFDTENRKRLPKDLETPDLPAATRTDDVRAALSWVEDEFPDNVGDASTFNWPTTHAEAEVWLQRFLEDRLALFGPYEDAIAADQSWLFHSALSPLINTGLLDPGHVVTSALEHAAEHDVDLASIEGFVRQVIGWREYMRAAYLFHGRAMRTRNLLELGRSLAGSWYDGTSGLLPVDRVIQRVLSTGYAHHIERLMVLGNAMLLLRIDPDEVYEWFMVMFVDAYDWVMVPNVYAMSQFAAGTMITTKPYVSGSNYLRKMSDFPTGEWTHVWDALYWQFVADHRDLFLANPRSSMMVRSYDRMDPARRDALAATAKEWLDAGG